MASRVVREGRLGLPGDVKYLGVCARSEQTDTRQWLGGNGPETQEKGGAQARRAALAAAVTSNGGGGESTWAAGAVEPVVQEMGADERQPGGVTIGEGAVDAVVTRQQVKMRLDAFLASQTDRVSRARWQAAIREGQVSVNGLTQRKVSG